jgi:putative addiction module component (TIGR02574 family)
MLGGGSGRCGGWRRLSVRAARDDQWYHRVMLTPDLERALLHLSLQDRAHLAQVLLESLDQLPEQEVRQLWIEEARRRAEEIDQGKVQTVSGEELERQVQELFR